MEPTTNELSGYAVCGENVTSTPCLGQDNSDATKRTPRPLNSKDLEERDRNAVAYSKSLLQEGDTMVFISYPSNVEVYDHTGFQVTGQAPFRIHSQKLLATGSKKFKELLSEWPQAKFRRRKGFYGGNLPPGISYVLDLTPPDEGDEAVQLTTELSCSLGVRYWFAAQSRCKVPASFCGGKDEIGKPAKPSQKDHHDLIEALADQDFGPGTSIMEDLANYEDITGEGSDLKGLAQPGNGTTSLAEREEADLREALQQSKVENFNYSPAKDRYESVEEIPEYCPIRHRIGIQRLLQVIEGKEPQLDTAPKVWTLAVLAKYFDCSKAVVDYIVSWVLNEPNSQFVEILPEATLQMGFMLQCASLTRPAFAILVSEHALSTISRECEYFDVDQKRFSQFGRPREIFDEDIQNAVQPAAYAFLSRIEDTWKELCHPNMPWYEKLPEYKKLDRFVEWAATSTIGEDEKKLINLNTEALKDGLKHFVRGHILWCLNRNLETDDIMQADAHRRAESYLKPYWSSFVSDVYAPMAEKERIMTRFPWKALKDDAIDSGVMTSLKLDDGMDHSIISKSRKLRKPQGVQRIAMFDVGNFHLQLHDLMVMAVQRYGFNGGRVTEGIRGVHKTNGVDNSTSIGDDDDWRFPATTIGEFTLSGTARDTFQAAPPDWMQHNFSHAADSPSGQNFPNFVRARDQDDMLERLEGTGSSASSVQEIISLPIRTREPKDDDEKPLLEKESILEDPFIPGAEKADISTSHEKPTTSMASWCVNRISNVFGSPSPLMSRHYRSGDPRTEAIDLHNQGSNFSTPKMPFSLRAKPIHPSSAFQTPTKLANPQVPGGQAMLDLDIPAYSPLFSLERFLKEVTEHVHGVADSILNNGEADFAILTDTLLCLTDDEWKYLPLWAGGNEDGSGGVFAPTVPPAFAGLGPSGPGPSYHTGYSTASSPSTLIDFDGASVDTSLAVDNGFFDHIDRRRVISNDGIASETFTDDTEEYVGNGKGVAGRVYDQALGEVKDCDITKPADPSDDDFGELESTEASDVEMGFEGEDEEEDEEEEEEAFDYGPEQDDGGDDILVL